MKHRIRTGVIILQGDKILLVENGHPLTDDIWWTPPGGGREAQDSDIFACARREVMEECGLEVELERIIYLREYYDAPLDTLMMEVYFLASHFQGTPRAEIESEGELPYPPITRVGWYTQNEIQPLIVFPEILKDEFWEDLKAGFPGVRYLPQRYPKE
jgi:8-oxo-dGTP pyrophosphatase MutT (NUDIX family)